MLQVLYEDNHVLAVCKPAGLIVQPDISGDPTLIDLAKRYRIEKEQKTGDAFIGPVHRLDRPVSGIVLLAKTSKAAARLTDQFRNSEIEKKYLAVVHAPRLPKPFGSEGEWRDTLVKNEQRNRVRVQSASGAKSLEPGKEAVTRLRILERHTDYWLMELRPITGRSHQLRVQCSYHRVPIVGDVKYGSSTKLGAFLALHAHAIRFRHPTTKASITVDAPMPESWNRFGFAPR